MFLLGLKEGGRERLPLVLSLGGERERKGGRDCHSLPLVLSLGGERGRSELESTKNESTETKKKKKKKNNKKEKPSLRA